MVCIMVEKLPWHKKPTNWSHKVEKPLYGEIINISSNRKKMELQLPYDCCNKFTIFEIYWCIAYYNWNIIPMSNPEKLATYSTQDTGQINVREHQRENQNEQCKETGNPIIKRSANHRWYSINTCWVNLGECFPLNGSNVS